MYCNVLETEYYTLTAGLVAEYILHYIVFVERHTIYYSVYSETVIYTYSSGHVRARCGYQDSGRLIHSFPSAKGLTHTLQLMKCFFQRDNI